MAQRVDINVNLVDAAARQKLDKWEYDTDKLRKTKVIVKFDADTGDATRKFARYTNDAGKVVDVNTQIKKSGQQVTTVTETTTEATKKAGDAAKKTAGQFTLLNTVFLRLAHTMLSSVVRSFKEAITEMKNVDTQLTVISRVTQTNIADLEKLKNKAYEVGSAYGVMASDYLSAAAAFSRAGYREQAEDLAELSSKLQIAGGVSADVANQFLIATDKAYQLNGSVTDLSEVMDKLTVIDHNYATSVEKIADGMGIVAPVAAQAHMSTDELVASLGTITAVTQRSGTEAARALRALILSIIKDTTSEIDEGVTWTIEEINSLQDALKLYAPEVVKAAEATGQLIDPMEAIAALAKSYEDGLLTEAKLADLTSKLGGKLRASQLLSLIQNYSGMYTDMLNQMQSATGAVDKDIEKSLESWEVKIKQLKNTFTEFVQKSLSSDFFKGLLDSVKWLIEGFGDLGTAVGIFGAAILAIKFPSIIQSLSNLTTMITNVGGGFKNAITVLFNYKTMSGLVEGSNYSQAASFATAQAAASAYSLVIAGVALAITGLVVGYNKYKQAESDRAKASKSAAEKSREETKTLEELYKKYIEAKDGSETQRKASENLAQALGVEKDAVDDLTSSYYGLIKAKHESSSADAYQAVKDYEKILREELSPSFSTFGKKVGVSKTIDLSGFLFSSVLGRELTPQQLFGSFAEQFSEIYEQYNGAESSAENLVELFEKLYGLQEDMRVAQERGDTLPSGYSYLQKWLAESESAVSNYNDAWNTYVEAKARESAFSDETIKNIKTQEEFDRALKDASESGIRGYADAMEKVLNEMFPQFAKGTEDSTSAIEEETKSVEGLTKELETATKALDKYKKALEGGEKGDALKSYSEAYKKAVELYEKGLTGSNQYMSAVDLLFGGVDDYEEAGKLLGNAFVKAMFEGGGEDYGANAANYIRKHIEEFEGVQITGGENGTFGLMVTDMDKFAESTGLTADALWTLIDALDIFDSKTTYTRDQLFNFMGLEDNGAGGIVNLTEMINNLAGQGKSAREIKEIVDAVKELAKTDGNITISEPEDLDQTIDDIVELNKEAEKDKDMEVVLTSNSDEFFDGIYKQIDQLNGTTIYIGLKTVGGSSGGSSVGSSSGISKKDAFKFWQADSRATGTRSARGGLSLVNEEGAELIYANGRAWIAGGGDPTITNLPVGSGVFNAKETREILARSGIASNAGTYVGGIPTFTSGGSGKSGRGKLTESLLEQIAEYINDILKKAKEALQEQLDAIDEQIEKLKREHDAEEDANKLEELRLKILEAEKKLAEAENERTVRYFNKETGQWEWMADQKAVADAQKALKDAQEAYDKEVAEQAYEAQLQALQDQKKSLNEAYEQLSDNWDKIYEELQDILNGKGAVDIAKLIQQLLGTKGGSYAPDIQALLEAIGSFTANPTSVLDAATTARIMSTNVATGGATSVLSAMLGSGSYDLNGRGQSTLGGNTSIVGDTIYYINGVQIGSDMMDKPLSQILSVLPIYAN